MPIFDNPNSFENILRKRRKCWLPEVLPFPTLYFTHLKTSRLFLFTSDLSSANTLHVEKSKFLSSIKALKAL